MNENINISEKYKILEFRKININDIYDERFDDGFAWSRVYEYPLVLNIIETNYGHDYNISIHNTSWGFQGVHTTFKNIIDSLYKNAVHSDILSSDLEKTFIYDITKTPNEDFLEKFDVVINISTVEEVSHDHLSVLNNLLSQVKQNGLLIITFDLPGLQIDKIEQFFGIKLITSDSDICGINSKLVNKICENLNCGILVIKK